MNKTIAKNRLEQFIPRIQNVRVYSLENSFSGKHAQSDEAAINFAVKVGAKFIHDASTGTGQARCHSNLWYEFDVDPA